jgi:iron complex transport system substrate-binding protein
MVPPPRVVALNPADLEGVLADVLAVGAAVGLEAGARAARGALQARIDAAAADARAARGAAQRWEAPSVAFIEWADPIYVGGHWTPQLIEMAGGAHPLNPAGRGGDAGAGAGKSFAVAPGAVEASSPDVLVMCPCGLTLQQTEAEAFALLDRVPGTDAAWFARVRAVRDGRVALVDGNQAPPHPASWLHDLPVP